MILIDIPVVAYETWGIAIYKATPHGLVRGYEAEDKFERTADVCKAYPYSSEHPHIK